MRRALLALARAVVVVGGAGACLPGVELQTPGGAGPGSACAKDHTVSGSFAITQPSDITRLAGCTTVAGTLVAADTLLEGIALPDLQLVGGDVLISGNADLASLDLRSLATVRGTLSIIDTAPGGAPLASINLSSLGSAGLVVGRAVVNPAGPDPTASQCGLQVSAPPAFPHLSTLDLPELTHAAELLVIATAIASLHAPLLANVDGDVCFDADRALDLGGDHPPLPALVSASSLGVDDGAAVSIVMPLLHETPHGVQINRNASLTSLSFPALDTSGAPVVISENSSLPECDAELAAIAMVIGSFQAGGAPALPTVRDNAIVDIIANDDTALAAAAGVTCASGDVHIGANVTSLAPLASLQYIAGSLIVLGASASVSAVSLPQLFHVRDVVDVERTNATSISLPALRGIGDVTNSKITRFGATGGVSIGRNAALTSVDFGQAHFVGTGAGFQVFENAEYATCDADALRTALCGGLPGGACQAAIFGNAPGCVDTSSPHCPPTTGDSDALVCPNEPACGDGVVSAGEDCDDGGRAPLDGCSANCFGEASFVCTDSPSTCVRCQQVGGCCGDSTLAGEACDDGNTQSGDGCSSACAVEAGFRCTNANDTVASVCVVAEGEGEGAGEGEGEGGAVVCVPQQPDSNTVGLWHFDRAATPGTSDAPPAPDLTLGDAGGVNVPGFEPVGRFGSDLHFGSSAVARANFPAGATSLNRTTVELWLFPGAAGAGDVVTLQGATSTLKRSIGAAGLTWGTATHVISAPLAAGVFHRIAARCDAGLLALFVDGTRAGGAADPCDITADTLDTITIGGPSSFQGSIDDVRVSNTGRSDLVLGAACQ